MCDCVNRIEEKILKEVFLKDMAKEEVIDPKCHFENRFIGGSYPLASAIRIDYSHRTKNGKEIKRSKTYNMLFEYCPFCGEKIPRTEKVDR